MEIKNKHLDCVRDKKVLLVGLGILGGGVATAKWLIKNGANLTITDLKDEKYLASSLIKLEQTVNSKQQKVKFVLGGHDENDFKNSDLIVLNPDVPVDSPFVKIAKKHKVPITNELNLFVENVKTKNIVAITGTRGKTTTTQWTAFLMNKILGPTHLVGNSPQTPFLGMITKIKENDYVVLEVPSYHLEIVNKSFKPKVSVITNIFVDHINRHKTEANYAKIKANIFKYQKADDYLILNKGNKWTKEIIGKREKGTPRLRSGKEGRRDKPEVVLFPDEKVLPELPKDFGEHNKQNLTIAILILKIFGADISKVKKYIKDLPQPIFRQEKIYEDKNLKVINDSAATSPEATIAAVKRFSSSIIPVKAPHHTVQDTAGIQALKNNLILITGGTDKGLEYKELGNFLSKNISSERLILLEGSATEKLKKNLFTQHVIPAKAGIQASKGRNLNEFETLEECLEYSKKQIVNSQKSKWKSVLIFSPGAKSFEKFKNEFDRGEKFNKLFEKIFQK